MFYLPNYINIYKLGWLINGIKGENHTALSMDTEEKIWQDLTSVHEKKKTINKMVGK